MTLRAFIFISAPLALMGCGDDPRCAAQTCYCAYDVQADVMYTGCVKITPTEGEAQQLECRSASGGQSTLTMTSKEDWALSELGSSECPRSKRHGLLDGIRGG